MIDPDRIPEVRETMVKLVQDAYRITERDADRYIALREQGWTGEAEFFLQMKVWDAAK